MGSIASKKNARYMSSQASTDESLVAKKSASASKSASADLLDILVLAGGPSAERDVSLQSGAAVAAALTSRGHRVTVCDIGPADLSALDKPYDFVFPALHGEFGEDGTVQKELERRNLPYAGTGVAASVLTMDKVASKRRFSEHDIPTPVFELANRDNIDNILASFEPPAVVKPNASGSSVDTTIAKTAVQLETAAKALIGKQGEALIERYVAGRELTVGILGDVALPVCEICTPREFYDYQAKYVDDTTQYLFDFDLPEALLERVQALSLQAHRALGCQVMSRVDWMIDGKTLEPFALEVNTIPGFTSHSLVPKAAARMGIDFGELCQRIVDLSRQIDRRMAQ